jgi:hypothetical protein
MGAKYLILVTEIGCYPAILAYKTREERDKIYKELKANGYYYDTPRDKKIKFDRLIRANILNELKEKQNEQ